MSTPPRISSLPSAPLPSLDKVLDRLMELTAENFAETTPEEVLDWATSSAMWTFNRRLQEMRGAIETDRETRNRTNYRPIQLHANDAGLNTKERKAAEVAAERLVQRFQTIVEEMTPQFEYESSPDVPQYQFASSRDWNVPAILLLVGPQRSRDEFAQFLAELGKIGEGAQDYGMAYLEWHTGRNQPSPLPTAIIPAAIAEFEVLLATLLRIALTLYPQSLRVDERRFSIAEMHAVGGNASQVQLLAIETVVNEYLHETIEEWSVRLERWPGINLNALTSNWSQFVEIFCRRNVIVHNNGRVDSDYLRRLPKALDVPQAGAQLKTDHDYALTTIDSLGLAGMALATLWGPKLRPAGGVNSGMANHVVYCALELARWSDAELLADLFLPLVEDNKQTDLLLVNKWLARREETQSIESVSSFVEAWEPSNDEWRWKLAKPALLLDERAAERVIRDAVSAGVRMERFTRQPLFSLMLKRYPKLRSALVPHRNQRVRYKK